MSLSSFLVRYSTILKYLSNWSLFDHVIAILFYMERREDLMYGEKVHVELRIRASFLFLFSPYLSFRRKISVLFHFNISTFQHFVSTFQHLISTFQHYISTFQHSAFQLLTNLSRLPCLRETARDSIELREISITWNWSRTNHRWPRRAKFPISIVNFPREQPPPSKLETSKNDSQ